MSFRVFVYNQSFFQLQEEFPTYTHHPVYHFRHLKDIINEGPSWRAGSAHIDLISHYFHCLMCKWVADSSHNATSCRVPLTPQSETMTWAQRGVDPICPPPLNMTRHFWLLCFQKNTDGKWELALCRLGQTQVILSFVMKYSWNEVSGNFSLRDWKLVQVSYHSEQ